MKFNIDFSWMKERLHNREQVIVSGHRGEAAIYPENTILSFKKAIEAEVGSLETDLNITSDGEVILIHDNTLDRTTNGTGATRSCTLAEIKELDAGCKFKGTYEGEVLRVPSLTEFCEFISSYPDILLNIEIKDYAHEVVDKAVKTLYDYDIIKRCVFTCFESDVIHYMKDEYNLPVQGFHESQLKHFVQGESGTYSKMYAVGIPMRLLTPEMCGFFENMGILAWSYCPDDDESVILSLECGARLMTVNNPEPALRICREKGIL